MKLRQTQLAVLVVLAVLLLLHFVPVSTKRIPICSGQPMQSSYRLVTGELGQYQKAKGVVDDIGCVGSACASCGFELASERLYLYVL